MSFPELTSKFVDKEPTCPKLWLCLQDFIWDSLDFDPQLLNNGCFMKSIMQSQVVSIQSYLVNFYIVQIITGHMYLGILQYYFFYLFLSCLLYSNFCTNINQACPTIIFFYCVHSCKSENFNFYCVIINNVY